MAFPPRPLRKLLTIEEETALLPGRHVCEAASLRVSCQRPSIIAFLELCCQLCFDSACLLREDLIQLAQELWHDLLIMSCQSAMLAAAVVLLQSPAAFEIETGVELLQTYLKTDLTWSPKTGAGNLPRLYPFPFAAEFLVLYQNFVPLSMLPSCQQTDSFGGVEVFRVACSRAADGYTEGSWARNCSQEPGFKSTTLLPSRAQLSKVGCISEADDRTLALRCRSRRFDSFLLSPSAGLKEENAFQWRCPAYASVGVWNKYSFLANRSCASGFGSWGMRIESQLKCVAVQVAETLQLRPGQSVLDWGSGCGWALTWMSTLYGIRGFGIEATAQNVAWANRFSQGKYCLYGDFDLGWVPDASFDAVISYWALYHHNVSTQCHLIRQLVRKLRPGGRAWFGGNVPSSAINIGNEPFRRRDWKRCLISLAQVGGIPVSLDFMADAALFRRNLFEIGPKPGDYLYFHPTYSVLLRRMS